MNDAPSSHATKKTEPIVRPATLRDAGMILRLINELALKQVLLPRSPASVIESIQKFVVAEVDGRFAGCGALHVVWTDLAEVRSIAVDPAHQRHGIGRRIIDCLVDQARELGVPRLFAFTYVPGFFEKMGFGLVAHQDLPHKVFNDCLHCPKFTACDEIAMQRVLDHAPSDPPSIGGGIPITNMPMPQRTSAFKG